MSADAYLLGVALTAAIVGALAYGATGVRRRFLPDWVGPLGVLTAFVLGIAAAMLTGELLGVIGLFERWAVAIALVLIGGTSGWWARRGAPPPPPPPATASRTSQPTLARVATIFGFALAALVVAQWGAHVVEAYRGGMWDGDTIWYHLPFANHFVMTGYTTRPLYTNGDALVTFFPANSEIMSGLAILPFGRDLLVPMLNMGWLSLALLSGWCVGRRYGAAPLGLVSVAVVASLPIMASTQAGTARNDIVSLALFLAAVAIIVNSPWDRASVMIGAVAAGLCVGVKLSSVVPAVLLVLGAVAVMPRARRWTLAPISLTTFGAVGSFWYLRNLAVVGNPFPFLHLHAGPIDLRSVLTNRITNTAITDRLREPGAWGTIFHPGLHDAFGPVWWLVLFAAAVGVVVAIFGGRDARVRMLGAIAIGAGIAYVLQPGGVQGTGVLGRPTFVLNLRYVTPTLALALIVLPTRLRPESARVRLVVLGVLGAVVVTNQFPRELQRLQHGLTSWEWPLSAADTALGLVFGALTFGAAILIIWARPRSQVLLATGVAVAIIGVAVGYEAQGHYADHRYAVPRRGLDVSAAFPWAQRVHDTRIALAGDFFQYPFAGPDLGNVVRFGGVLRSDGSFRVAQSCSEWRRFLADGHFRYVVVSPPALKFDPSVGLAKAWTSTIQGVHQVLHQGGVSVFRLDRPANPLSC